MFEKVAFKNNKVFFSFFLYLKLGVSSFWLAFAAYWPFRFYGSFCNGLSNFTSLLII